LELGFLVQRLQQRIAHEIRLTEKSALDIGMIERRSRLRFLLAARRARSSTSILRPIIFNATRRRRRISSAR
jgi:hypothetical protein